MQIKEFSSRISSGNDERISADRIYVTWSISQFCA